MEGEITRLITPKGTEIVGTLETLTGRADIESFRLDEDTGEVGFEYGGYTEVFWNDQRTVKRGGKILFLDENGDDYIIDELKLVDENGNAVPIPGSKKARVSELIRENAT